MFKRIAAICLCLVAFACGGTEYDVEDEAFIEEELRISQTAGGTDGGACKVTSGTNTGKSGTYETDDDGYQWCCGSWGCTECTGGGRCSNALTRYGSFSGSTSGTVYSGP